MRRGGRSWYRKLRRPRPFRRAPPRAAAHTCPTSAPGLRTGRAAAAAELSVRYSFVFGVNVVDIPLNEPLHHGVQGEAALRARGDTGYRGGFAAHFHLQFVVSGGHLFRRGGIQDLVAHPYDPNTGGG